MTLTVHVKEPSPNVATTDTVEAPESGLGRLDRESLVQEGSPVKVVSSWRPRVGVGAEAAAGVGEMSAANLMVPPSSSCRARG